MESLYTSLEEAKEELINRREAGVQVSVLGALPNGIPQFPFVAALDHVASANFWDIEFYKLSQRIGFNPVWIEYLDDSFHASNPDKQNLVTLYFYQGEGRKGGPKLKKAKIIRDHNEWEGRKLIEIKTCWNTSLVNLHHRMREELFPNEGAARFDISSWYRRHGGRASVYYPFLLKLFVAHGILVEDFHVKSSHLEKFRHKIVTPSFESVTKETGLRPLIVQLPWERKMDWLPGELSKFLP